jgi:hypothetical protein
MEFNEENIRQEQIKNAKLYSTRYEYAQENILPGSSILEVGTLAGDYADYLLQNCNPSFIELLDKFDQHDWEVPGYTKRFTGRNHYDFVVNRFKDDNRVKITHGLLHDVLPSIKTRYDYIYLDANHTEESVRFQLHCASQLLNPGGVIGINDYLRFGIIRKEDYGTARYEDIVYGTVPAVNNFLLDNRDWQVKAYALNDRLFSDIYIHKPGK